MNIPFVGAAYTVRSPNLDCQNCINLYPVIDESGEGKSIKALYGTPGTRLLSTLTGIGGVRGMLKLTSTSAVAVQGSSVFMLDNNFAATFVGSLLSTNGPVSIETNGASAVIVDGPNGYSINLSDNSFAQIVDAAFYGSKQVHYLDNYYIFVRPDTQQFYISGLGTVTFDALDFASSDGEPGNIVTHFVDHREIWIFSTVSTALFVDSGGGDFPFVRTDTAIEVGCAAPYSVCKIDNSIMWVGQDKQGPGLVWKANGYTPVRASTEALEFAIQNYSRIDDAIAYSYQDEGHSFYVLTFPTANKTWVYDAGVSAALGQNVWHERAWRNPSDATLNRHRSNCHMYFGGEHIVGDFENGNLYALDLDYYSDNGDPLPAIRTTPHISNPDEYWMYWDRLTIQAEGGVGLQTGQGSDPQILLDWSDDGGHVFGNKHQISIGRVGKYRNRAFITRMGRSRDRVLRITITDPVKRAITGAHAKIRLGSS